MFQKLLAGFFAVALLPGCVNNPAPLTSDSVSGSARQMTAAMDAAVGQAAKMSPTNSAAILSDPTLITFDKMSAKLTPSGSAQLVAMMPVFKVSKNIVVQGYCYRKDIGNAKAAAKARAETVVVFLIKAGIPAKRIQSKIDTTRPMHAVRVSFSG